MEHVAAATDCSTRLFGRTMCTVPDAVVDGGAYGCAQIVASCPADESGPGITIDDCQRFLSPFNDLARQGIIACFLDSSGPQGTSCADKFENECVFPQGP